VKSLPERWGNFEGIHGLPLIIVASHALVYLFELLNPGLTPWLELSREGLALGEWWRPLTFLFVPPALSPLFEFFWLYLLYVYADALEQQWGSFRFTVFYLAGALATAVTAFHPSGEAVPTVYLNAMLFVAFATLFPKFELWLFFVLPVQVRWLAAATLAWMAWRVWVGGPATRLAVAAAWAGYALVLGPDLWERFLLWREVRRNRRRFER
jgi:membrane associated rhomboid family serine protease